MSSSRSPVKFSLSSDGEGGHSISMKASEQHQKEIHSGFGPSCQKPPIAWHSFSSSWLWQALGTVGPRRLFFFLLFPFCFWGFGIAHVATFHIVSRSIHPCGLFLFLLHTATQGSTLLLGVSSQSAAGGQCSCVWTHSDKPHGSMTPLVQDSLLPPLSFFLS